MIGRTLAHYEITSQIGKGGMGEVYQAKDMKLGRDVAIKVLPEEFARDHDRVARFQREAKLLASLNHPNIAAIYGLEESDDIHFLVMELIEGDTLADRLKRGPIPVEESLKLALQIAEALEAAHEKGVIHRDLKPANIKATPDGKVKILDFGLAKAFTGDQGEVNLADSPTVSVAATQKGVILGTAAYMSPEQAKGKVVDKRTDIWAFGCVLFEMITGKSAFQGEDLSEVLASVIKGDSNLAQLPVNIHTRIREVFSRCLQKDLRKRYADIADARYEIEQVMADPHGVLVQPVMAVKPKKGLRLGLPWVVAVLILGLIIAGAAVWYLKSPPYGDQNPIYVEVNLPPGDQLMTDLAPPIAVSPDGRSLAYVAIHSGVNKLFVRSLDSYKIRLLPGTEGAEHPFFSPDSKWIGFYNSDHLMKVSLAGETPTPIYDIGSSGGATWGEDDTIVFAPTGDSCLMRVSADGGEATILTDLDRAQGESSHRWPQFLPGGKALLFTALGGNGWDEFKIVALRLDTGERSTVLKGGHTGRFVPTEHSAGHLVYYRANKLLAIPFDPIHLKIIGSSPVTIVEGIAESASPIGAEYSFSASGSLAYVPASLRYLDRQLVWVDRKGTVEPIPDAGVRSYYNKIWLGLSISPDGKRAAVQIDSGTTEIWVYDIERHTMSQCTSEGSSSQFPIWTQDGERITYTGFRDGLRNIYWKIADGKGEEQRITEGENMQTPRSWSPKGELCFTDWSPTTKNDLWILRLDGNRRQEPFLSTQFQEGEAQFSPNGSWLAYVTNETGRREVYVLRYPETSKPWQISREGGDAPLWSHDGSELFYRNGDKMMAVDIKTEPGFIAGKPRLLFEGQFGPGDVASDGRFLMVQPLEPEQPATKIHLVLNWFEELKQKAPLP